MPKKVLFHSDFALAKTGFGRVMKALLSHLYRTGKYDIYHYCCGMHEGDPGLKNTPWKSIGSLPSDQEELSELSKDPQAARAAGYGSYSIDKVINEVRPDVYIGAQDWWGVDYVVDKSWFSNLTSALWITLDSVPILKQAVSNAHKVKNYWVWSNFAEKALKEQGESHVKTVHGPIESKHFYKLPESQRKELRKKFGLEEDAFIIGFVFRNQLRKLVPNVIEGYKLWKRQNPEIKNTYLLFHTNFSEGWNIKDQADLYGVDTKEILTTYICRKCRKYEVKTFDDRKSKYQLDNKGEYLLDAKGKKKEIDLDPQNKDCPYCKAEKSQVTTGVGFGITEKELNEIYNLMDVYLHAFTSGGQEIPIQEAKLCELITLVTNYSCGEEMCEPAAKSLPLDWNKYVEHGTEFIKASTSPGSICKQLSKICNMSKADKEKWGREAREWAILNYSIENIGAEFERFLDSAPEVDQKNDKLFMGNSELPNPTASVESFSDNATWIKALYKNVLDREVTDDYDGFQYWMKEIGRGTERDAIEKYFRHVAQKTLTEKVGKNDWKKKIKDSFTSPDKKRILLAMPHSLNDCLAALSVAQQLQEHYGKDKWEVYVATERRYKDIFDAAIGHDIANWIEFVPEMDNQKLMESKSEDGRLFDICFNPYFNTQKIENFQHNGEDKICI